MGEVKIFKKTLPRESTLFNDSLHVVIKGKNKSTDILGIKINSVIKYH